MAKAKNWDRLSAATLEPATDGRIFVSGAAGGKLFDLSSVLVCRAGVDTVRQLYRGMLRADVLAELEVSGDNGGEIWEQTAWGPVHVGRAPVGSGYKHKFQSNAEGFTVLIKSHFCVEDAPGPHVKIELSPHFIAQRGVKQIQEQLDLLANYFVGDWKADGVAVHLATDVQGWKPPEDMRQKFVSRARAVQDWSGIGEVEIAGLRDVCVMYGDSDTYLWGKADSLQFTAYRKDKEIVKRDKVDFWHDEWLTHTFGGFDADAPVWRFEARFHHQVVREIGNGMGVELARFDQVAEHLTDFWRYALQLNRLDFTSTFINPFWQLLRDDVEFYHPASRLEIRRTKKTDTEGVGRNYGNILGNLITVGARMGWNLDILWTQVKRLGFFPDIVSFYRSRGRSETELREWMGRGLFERRLLGKAA
ncbi:hypothetical protein [Thiohalomonas denitrificans]|uniref:Replication initiation factor n=1 Tax=Thiohalomonas denitrificans TaxID=415747 RepID=A0A1G5PTT8_9GAMM|nr:hypothetical protein [Thiohalomonas denitrificans]SCZ52943.1 hypothetical protein SAMN03097708_00836 [Thiohalomonas denitrificans]